MCAISSKGRSGQKKKKKKKEVEIMKRRREKGRNARLAEDVMQCGVTEARRVEVARERRGGLGWGDDD